jgi:hypothetical protein
LILLFEKLFGSALWLAFAVFQNGLDILASVYLATVFSGRISKVCQLAIVVLIALFSYFSAFHNALVYRTLAGIGLFIPALTLSLWPTPTTSIGNWMIALAMRSKVQFPTPPYCTSSKPKITE